MPCSHQAIHHCSACTAQTLLFLAVLVSNQFFSSILFAFSVTVLTRCSCRCFCCQAVEAVDMILKLLCKHFCDGILLFMAEQKIPFLLLFGVTVSCKLLGLIGLRLWIVLI